MYRLGLLLVTAAVTLTACGGASNAATPGPIVVLTTAAPSAAPLPPVPVGTAAKVSTEWSVRVAGVDLNADAAVTGAAGENNAPPKHGDHYVTVSLAGVKLSAGSGGLFQDTDFSLVGAATHVLYEPAQAVPPHYLGHSPEVVKGGKASGEMVFEVAKTDATGSLVLMAQNVDGSPAREFKIQ